MSENPQIPPNGLQVNAGPVTVAANGSTTVQVLLSACIVAASMYVVYTNNQRSDQMEAMFTMQHNAIMVGVNGMVTSMNAIATSNENLFLSNMLPDGRKKDLPSYIQDKARAIVEQRAETITDKRQ